MIVPLHYYLDIVSPTPTLILKQSRHILSAHCDLLGCRRTRLALVFRQQLNLPHQKTLLVQKLIILRPSLQKPRQEPQQSSPILDQNLPHIVTLVGVCNENFEHMEGLILNHLPVIFQQVHGEFQIVTRIDVFGHHNVVAAVEQDFPEQFNRLPFCDI